MECVLCRRAILERVGCWLGGSGRGAIDFNSGQLCEREMEVCFVFYSSLSMCIANTIISGRFIDEVISDSIFWFIEAIFGNRPIETVHGFY